MTCVKCGAMWCFTCEFAFAPLELCPCEKNEMWRMKRRKAWRTIKNAMLYVLGGGFAMVMFGLIARVLVPHSQLAFEVAIFEGALVGAVCIDWYLH